MHNSLILQSRELIGKLTEKNSLIHSKYAIEKNNSFDNLLKNEDNLRKKSTDIYTHKLSDSMPKSTISSILSRSAYMSKSVDKLSNSDNYNNFSEKFMPKRIPFCMSNSSDQIMAPSNNCTDLRSLDLLGYDWIAAMMENKAKEAHLDQPNEYFEELERFRRKNKQYCISAQNRQTSNIVYTSQKCDYSKTFHDFNYQTHSNDTSSSERFVDGRPEVYAYTLNERLFPIPLDMETAERGPPDPNNPHIIKVSIPSNRFVHRNQKMYLLKEKTFAHDQPATEQQLGESLSLSSHCQTSKGGYIQRKTIVSSKPGHQEPASLRGHISMESAAHSDLITESISPFCGGNQPRNEEEAINQLQRGKTGAKCTRMVPSVLEKRGLNLDIPVEPMNICQTRITLKDMDESVPRNPITLSRRVEDSDPLVAKHDSRVSEDVPRASLSRKQMSKVYGDAIRNVWENAD